MCPSRRKRQAGRAGDGIGEGGAASGVVLEIEVGLDQLQFHQHRRARRVAADVDAGVEQILVDRGEKASAAARSSLAGK